MRRTSRAAPTLIGRLRTAGPPVCPDKPSDRVYTSRGTSPIRRAVPRGLSRLFDNPARTMVLDRNSGGLRAERTQARPGPGGHGPARRRVGVPSEPSEPNQLPTGPRPFPGDRGESRAAAVARGEAKTPVGARSFGDSIGDGARVLAVSVGPPERPR